MQFRDEVAGEKIKLIQLDDGSDPSAATRDARKLIQENKVDVLIGTSCAPSTIAMTAVATELHVPMIAISPVTVSPADGGERWAICVPQPAPLMMKTITDRMEQEGAKSDRLHRLLRRLGRPGLQRRQARRRPTARSPSPPTSATPGPTPPSPGRS